MLKIHVTNSSSVSVAAYAPTAAEISIGPCLSEFKCVFSDMIFYIVLRAFFMITIITDIAYLHVDPQVLRQEIGLLTLRKAF